MKGITRLKREMKVKVNSSILEKYLMEGKSCGLESAAL